MCDIATALGMAFSIFQGAQANKQAKAQAKLQEGIAKVNARNQENEAIKTRNKGVEEENRQRALTAQLLGKQRAQLGANGVLTDLGSALQLQEDTVQLGESDALRVRGNFADQAESIDQGATNTLFQGEADAAATRAKGSAAFTSGLIGAASVGLPVASKWYSSKSAATSAVGNRNVAANGGF